MRLWDEEVVPRVTDKLLGNADVRAQRARVVGGLQGTVVEIGFGSGLNVPVYPPEIRTVLAIEPSEVARRLARPRVSASPVHVEYRGLDGQRLPLDDASVDGALSTFTLCTIPDASLALRELLRVLKPGGTFHFLEHGLSPDPKVARWQHRLNGMQRACAGGCNLDRAIDHLIADAGFEIPELHHDSMKGPKFMAPWSHLYTGLAIKPDA
jgi:ubiquinone/menaquinone biosynthesis C-methylase UbiE